MRRPPILDKEGNIHNNVKGIILDMNGELMGVVLATPFETVIEFFSTISPCIIYDKPSGEFEIYAEIYPSNPKRVLQKKVKELMKRW